MKQWKIFAAFAAIFLAAYFLPLSNPKITAAILEAFKLLQWYARNHTLACVVPALFIAGAIITFLSKASVLRYLGPKSNKLAAYSVASVSGTVLSVCSCSVLPMFAGIYRLGAGLGPASAFLYAGPAINVMAIFLTARVLGFEIGLARVIGAVGFAFLVGLGMAVTFRRQEKAKAAVSLPEEPPSRRRPWQTGLFLSCMVGFLVFSDWFHPGDAVVRKTDGTPLQCVVLQETRDEVMIQVQEPGGTLRAGDKVVLSKDEVAAIEDVRSWVMDVYRLRWYLAGCLGLAVLVMAFRWYGRSELREWMLNTWDFSKLLVPLLFGGVFLVGFIGALLPDEQVGKLVGDNGLSSNLVGSVVGALFYFATLTEVPIVQALMEHGMARGPALALLLAGPAISLPNILVLWRVMGAARTLVFCGLVVVMATIAGLLYGMLICSVT